LTEFAVLVATVYTLLMITL